MRGCAVSSKCNFSLINSPPDSVKTLKVWLDYLKKEVIEPSGQSKIIIAGDGKTIGLLTDIKFDYPNTYDWAELYLGEFHRNSIYMRCILKFYAGAGLETLAKLTYGGTLLSKIMKAKHYRKTLRFLFNVTDVVLILILDSF